VVKSSGSGNAASITGGVTLISELNLTTDLADSHIASAATWNAKAPTANPTFTGTVTTPALTISALTAGSTSDSVVTVNAATGVLYRRAFPSSGGGSGWSLTGNAGTTAGTNFIGTTDAQDFHVRAGNNLKVIIPKNYAFAQPALGFYDGASFVVNVGASSAVGYGAIMGADFSGNFYIQSQSLGAPTAFPLLLQGRGSTVSIGTLTANPRALLDVNASGTTKGGFKLPVLTTTERNAITWVAGDAGMLIFNSTTSKAQVWDGTSWNDLH
jgi:hypothetical protein